MRRCQTLSASLFVVTLTLTAAACRWQSSDSTDVSTGQFGSGSGTYTAQCSGDFPDWISDHPPVAVGGDVNPQESGVQTAFQLAQAFPIGVPVFGKIGGPLIDHWEPPRVRMCWSTRLPGSCRIR